MKGNPVLTITMVGEPAIGKTTWSRKIAALAADEFHVIIREPESYTDAAFRKELNKLKQDHARSKIMVIIIEGPKK